MSTKPGGQPARRRFGRRFVSVGLAVVPAVVVGVALAVAGDGGSGPLDREDPAVEQIAPGLPTLVAAFRRSQKPSDKIPGEDPLEALAQIGSLPGENPLLSRRLELVGGYEAYVWPAYDSVCYSWSGASGCTSTSVLAQRGVLIGTNSDGGSEVEVFGLARDGVSEIRFTLEDGREVLAPIENNGALVRLPMTRVEAHWKNPDGTSGRQGVPLG